MVTARAVALLVCGNEPGVRGRDLLLVSLDTLRADRLSRYGNLHMQTPALDQLASERTLFELAFSPVPSTLPSHAAIMRAAHPNRPGVTDN